MLILDILNNPQTERVGGFGHLKMGMVRTCYSYEIIINLLFMSFDCKYTTGSLNGGFIN